MTGKQDVHVLMLSDEDKKRLTTSTTKVIDVIDKETNNIQEKAFILRILIESFEETQKCVISFHNRYFHNRYTEPVFNYRKKFDC